MELIDKVMGFITDEHLIDSGDRIVIGLSGGADSVALFLLLHEIKDFYDLSLFPIHVHHHLRDEADQDMNFCQDLCKELSYDLEIIHVDVEDFLIQHKVSVEDGARTLRYGALEAYLKKVSGQKIAVAHHKDDQAETILYRLIRGSGLLGLSGMQPRNGHIVRPLLSLSKEDLIGYIHKHGVGYCEDATNKDTKFMRNKIRHELLPQLAEYNPNIVEVLSRSGKIFTEEESALAMEAQRLASDMVELESKDNRRIVSIDLLKLEKVHIAFQKRIIRIGLEKLKGNLKNIEYSHIERILELAQLQSGKEVPVTEGILAKKEYETILLERENQKEKKGQIAPIFLDSFPIKGYIQNANMTYSIRILPKSEYKELTNYKDSFKKGRDVYTKWFDYDKIKANLVFRTRIPGDRITIHENGDSKLLKKYFIDEKIPASVRNTVPLLACKEDVLWIVGYRSGEGYRIRSTTQNVLEVKLTKEDKNGKN